jgi:hypothetical protein
VTIYLKHTNNNESSKKSLSVGGCEWVRWKKLKNYVWGEM